MRKRDLYVMVFWVLLGLFVSIWSYAKLGIGKFSAPGSGLMPFLLGTLFTVLALYKVLTRIFSSSDQPAEEPTTEEQQQQVDYRKLIFVIIALFAYAILLEPLGFLLTTFLTMIILFRSAGFGRWTPAVIYALVVVLVTYFLFTYLGVRFPPGIFRALGLN